MVVVVSTWIAMGLTFHRYGYAPLIGVAIVLGCAGWWLLFVRVEPWLRRLTESWFGPREEAAMRGAAAAYAWRPFHPFLRGSARFLWLFVVVAPVVHVLLHR